MQKYAFKHIKHIVITSSIKSSPYAGVAVVQPLLPPSYLRKLSCKVQS